jgi:hypothetical protein
MATITSRPEGVMSRRILFLTLILVLLLAVGFVALITYQNIQASGEAFKSVVLTRAEHAAQTAVHEYDLTHSP